jgi:phosphoribosylformylglycinamidine synthase
VVVADLDGEFLHDGLPRRHLSARWQAPELEPPAPDAPEAISDGLARRLGHENLRSREAIVRRYDHEVQGGTIVRPLVGPGDGPGDAAVLVPLEVRAEHDGQGALPGVALAVGLDPLLGLRDPYAMAWSAIDEAVRNVVAVGGDPERIAILDNFSWGDPRLPDRLGALVRCARGCHDAALHYGTPFVSGKDSLNNEWTAPDGTRHAIPPTLVITALGLVPDVARTVTSAFTTPGDRVYVLGPTRDVAVPMPDEEAPHRYRALHRAIASGFVSSCHDVSEGGLAVALAEMARGGLLGADVDLALAPGAAHLREDRRAFAECPGRHLVAVPEAHAAAFEALMAGLTSAHIGWVVP